MHQAFRWPSVTSGNGRQRLSSSDATQFCRSAKDACQFFPSFLHVALALVQETGDAVDGHEFVFAGMPGAVVAVGLVMQDSIALKIRRVTGVPGF